MDIKEILSKTDHTLLRVDAVWQQVQLLIDDGIRYGTASVCIPPCFVKQAAAYADGRLPICTVIGFPNGYQTAEVKAFEAADAVNNGADEIDMVINIGDVKAGLYDKIAAEIDLVKNACNGKCLKVIVETCMLTDREKEKICDVVDASAADFIKTSTGFSSAGADDRDIALWKAQIRNGTKIKAAGGIRTCEQAESMLAAGADRIGASAMVNAAKDADNM